MSIEHKTYKAFNLLPYLDFSFETDFKSSTFRKNCSISSNAALFSYSTIQHTISVKMYKAWHKLTYSLYI